MKFVVKCLALFFALTVIWSLPIRVHSYHSEKAVLVGKQMDLASQDVSVDYAEQVLDLVNQERKQRNIPPLILSSKLMEAAAVRADEITKLFSHTRPNGEPCHSLIEDGAYTVGENIAAGYATPEETVRQWMSSSGHRANILNEDYTELGVGYAYREKSEYRYYWVQLFRRPMSRAIQRR